MESGRAGQCRVGVDGAVWDRVWRGGIIGEGWEDDTYLPDCAWKLRLLGSY